MPNVDHTLTSKFHCVNALIYCRHLDEMCPQKSFYRQQVGHKYWMSMQASQPEYEAHMLTVWPCILLSRRNQCDGTHNKTYN